MKTIKEGILPPPSEDTLIQGKCPRCGAEVEFKKSEAELSYFFSRKAYTIGCPTPACGSVIYAVP